MRQKKLQLAVCVQEKFPGPFISRHLFLAASSARVCFAAHCPARKNPLFEHLLCYDRRWLAGIQVQQSLSHTLVALLPGRSDLILFNQNVARFQVTLFTLQISGALAGPTCVDIQISDCGLILKRCRNKYPAFYWNMCF